jgi:hypothetical protein
MLACHGALPLLKKNGLLRSIQAKPGGAAFPLRGKTAAKGLCLSGGAAINSFAEIVPDGSSAHLSEIFTKKQSISILIN